MWPSSCKQLDHETRWEMAGRLSLFRPSPVKAAPTIWSPWLCPLGLSPANEIFTHVCYMYAINTPLQRTCGHDFQGMTQRTESCNPMVRLFNPFFENLKDVS
jgi:hypothetical protein